MVMRSSVLLAAHVHLGLQVADRLSGSLQVTPEEELVNLNIGSRPSR